jgi:hypothetical protein
MVSTRAAKRGGRHQVADLRLAELRNRQLAPFLLLDRAQPVAGALAMDDSEHQLAAFQQFLHRVGDPAVPPFFGARQQAVADAERRAAPLALHHPKPRRRPVRLPALRHRERATAVVDVDHPQHRHLRHPAELVESAGGARIDQPLVGHVAQQRFERDLLIALEGEGAGDLAFPGRPVGRLDEVENLLAAGQAAFGGRLRHLSYCAGTGGGT